MLMVALVSCLGVAYQDSKLPIPGANEQKKAEADVKALFKEEFATSKDRGAKQALAQKLLAQAADEKNSPVARFVVLRLARDLAVEALDLPTAFDSVDRMNQYFEMGAAVLTGATFTLERNSWKAFALNSARKYAASAEEVMTLTDAYLKLTSEALAEKNFADALQSAQLAEQYARLGKSPPAIDKASSIAKEIPELKKEDELFGSAITSKADDPQARLVKGRVALFVINDPNIGIEMLLGCSDEGLVAVAKLEKAKPAMSDAMVKIAEAWLGLSKKESNPLHKRRYFERCHFWFQEGIKNAGGLEKLKIEQRLAEVGEKSGRPVEVNLLRLVKATDAVQGSPWQCDGAKIVTPTGNYDRIQIPYEPGEEYVVTLVAQRQKGSNALYIGLVAEGSHFVVVLDGGQSGNESMVDGVGGKTSVSNDTTFKGKVFADERSKTIVCTVRRAGFQLTADGKKIIEWRAPEYKKVAVHPVVAMPNPKAMSIGTFHPVEWDNKELITLCFVKNHGRKGTT